MALTEEQKKKIEEEERFRAEVKHNLTTQKPKKSGIGVLGWILIIIFSPVVLFIVIFTFLISSVPGAVNNENTTPSDRMRELDGKVNFANDQFTITNRESEGWTDCWASLNKNYKYPTNISTVRFDVPARDTYIINAEDLVLSDGTRYDPYVIQYMNFSVSCKNGFGYWTW